MTDVDAAATGDRLRKGVADLLAAHDPSTTDRMDFLRARFDAGLAWVHYPEGLGGLGLSRSWQRTSPNTSCKRRACSSRSSWGTA